MSTRTWPLVLAIATAPVLIQGCGGSVRGPDIRFIDRQAADPVGPMVLVISIDAGGRLTLNQIETGTIAAPSLLNEKLRAVFDDRRRSSIEKTDLMIETIGPVAFDDVDRLIKSLQTLEPARITVVTK